MHLALVIGIVLYSLGFLFVFVSLAGFTIVDNWTSLTLNNWLRWTLIFLIIFIVSTLWFIVFLLEGGRSFFEEITKEWLQQIG